MPTFVFKWLGLMDVCDWFQATFNIQSVGILSILIILFLLMYSGAFLRIKNGWLGGLLYVLLLVAASLALGYFSSMTLDENLRLSEKQAAPFKSITSDGISTGGFLSRRKPLMGCVLISESTPRLYSQMQESVKDIVAGKPIQLQYSDRYEGVVVTTESGIVLNTYLISQGLATTTETTPGSYTECQRIAKKQRLGVWNTVITSGSRVGNFGFYWFCVLPILFFIGRRLQCLVNDMPR